MKNKILTGIAIIALCGLAGCQGKEVPEIASPELMTQKPIATTIPTLELTATPTLEPTLEPTAIPTLEPMATPTLEPTSTPTLEPTATPTLEPTSTPTPEATATPTLEPTSTPTPEPTTTPTLEPTSTPTPKPTATPTPRATSTPIPTATLTPEPTDALKIEEEYWFETETIGNKLMVDAEKLRVIVEDGKKVTITISGIEVQDSYVTDLDTSIKGESEYSWRVIMYNDDGQYEVITLNWAKNPGQNKEMAIKDMRHAMWYKDSSGHHYICDVEMFYTANSITWTFSIEDDYSLDFSKVKAYAVDIYRTDNQNYIIRKYRLKTPIAVMTPTETPKPSATPTPTPQLLNWEGIENNVRIKIENGKGIVLGLADTSATEVVIPAEVQGCPIVEIKYQAFMRCSNLERVSLPEGIISIGNNAFESCKKLSSINIPEGVTSIGSRAFSWCSSLSSINIPASVLKIGEAAFGMCENLAEIKVDEKNNNYVLRDGVLYDKALKTILCAPPAKTIKEYVVSNGVERIAEYAFGCSSLSSIILPEGIRSIGNGAFQECRNLNSVTIPKGVTSIGNMAFHDCRNLKRVSLPDGVTDIGMDAFSQCWSLESINIPKGITKINSYTFNFCSGISNISLPEGVTSIEEGAFEGCSSLESIYIPDSVTKIAKSAFADCDDLTIIASSGSYAEQYAKERGIPFTAR